MTAVGMPILFSAALCCLLRTERRKSLNPRIIFFESFIFFSKTNFRILLIIGTTNNNYQYIFNHNTAEAASLWFWKLWVCTAVFSIPIFFIALTPIFLAWYLSNFYVSLPIFRQKLHLVMKFRWLKLRIFLVLMLNIDPVFFSHFHRLQNVFQDIQFWNLSNGQFPYLIFWTKAQIVFIFRGKPFLMPTNVISEIQ